MSTTAGVGALNLVTFSRGPIGNLGNLHQWLWGAVVGSTKVQFTEPISFITKLEELRGFVQQKDMTWFGKLCLSVMNRLYNQPVQLEKPSPKFSVGTYANTVISSDIRPEDITIKKMASWTPKGATEATRIYVDAIVNGKQFNYYINKTGKNGRYQCKNNGISNVPFQLMIQKEADFLNLKTEQDIYAWTGKKVA